MVGAGESKEASLPTGYELKGEIANLLNVRFDFGNQKSGDHLIVQVLPEHVRLPDKQNDNLDPYVLEARHIRDGLPQLSIDNFIDT